MTTTDYIFIVVDLALWAAVIWHRAQAKAVGELWWSCVGIALIITLKIGVFADPFNQLTGGIYLDELVIHLTGIAVVTLTLGWVVLIRYGSRQPYQRARIATAAAMMVFLTVTWLLAPIYDIPASEDWIPETVLADPVMSVHWLGIHLYLLAFCVLFVRLAGKEVRALPPGYVRLSVGLLVAAAVLLGLNNAAESVAQIVVLATGAAESAVLMTAVNAVLVAVFALFFLAVTIPLARYRGGGAAGASAPDVRVASLWAWIQDAGSPGPSTGQQSMALASPGESLMDQVIDIRDRMWWLQGFVAPADLAAASRQARAQGLVFGTRARAYVTAVCLQLAAERAGSEAAPVSPPPANLGRLGGGRTISQEAHWLAAVSDALAVLRSNPDRSVLR